MPAPQYVCETEGAVALAAATAKTIVGVKAHANSGLLLCGFTMYLFVTNDSDSPVLGIYDLTSTPTNGGTVTVNIADWLRIT